MWLDQTTRKLQLVLEAAKATNDCQFAASYSDYTATTLGLAPFFGNSNGLTVVDLLPAPAAAGVQRRVNAISVYNRDTVISNVTVRYNDNGTLYQIGRWPLAPGESLFFQDARGWYPAILPSGGRYLRTFLLAGSAGGVLLSANAGMSGIYQMGSDVNFARARLVGGGGGGGGSQGTSGTNCGVGGGGAAGGYAEIMFARGATGQFAYTCGPGGSGGLNGTTDGNNGGTTTLTVGGVTVTANGGLGGKSMPLGTTAAFALGGASPALSTGADFNTGGAPGGWGRRQGAASGCSGAGGSGPFGAGGGGRAVDGVGNLPLGFGAGGGGACALTAIWGGSDGCAGCVVIDEFS